METSLEKLQHASDAALVRLFQRGSNRAFYVLVNRHQANLKKFAHTLLHDSDLEKDLIQIVWMEVITVLRNRTYTEKNHFKEWIQTLLRWRAISMRKKESHCAHGIIPDEEAQASETPDKVLFEKRLEEIRKSYNKLNKHVRMVVHLRLEKHLSFPEIATRLYTSTNNVTSWYSRAIKKLRKLHRK